MADRVAELLEIGLRDGGDFGIVFDGEQAPAGGATAALEIAGRGVAGASKLRGRNSVTACRAGQGRDSGGAADCRAKP